jgi:signal recognition particle receptor subunit beta
VSFDVGGGGSHRINKLLKDTYGVLADCRGLIWIVDSNDRDRIVEVREELHNFFRKMVPEKVPILILANKQDIPVRRRITPDCFCGLPTVSGRDDSYLYQG